MNDLYDVLVVGAGPTGLACGIEAQRANLNLLILEKGCLVNSLFHYPPNMTFFTTRELLEIGDLPFVSVNIKPGRAEALEYYRRVADHYHLPIHYEERVARVRKEDGAFVIDSGLRGGQHCKYHSRNVVLATGYYDLPNLMNVPGEDLPRSRIITLSRTSSSGAGWRWLGEAIRRRLRRWNSTATASR
jgi:thioredoxin reductase (NADPH)